MKHGDQNQLRTAGKHGGCDEARDEQRDETRFGRKVEHSTPGSEAAAARWRR